MEIITEKKTLKDHVEDVKCAVKRGARTTYRWAMENKELAIAACPVIVSVVRGGTIIVSDMMRRGNIKKAETLKTRFIYDRSAGHYWKLKKPLTQRQWMEISRRKDSGESMANILSSMRILD